MWRMAVTLLASGYIKEHSLMGLGTGLAAPPRVCGVQDPGPSTPELLGAAPTFNASASCGQGVEALPLTGDTVSN